MPTETVTSEEYNQQLFEALRQCMWCYQKVAVVTTCSARWPDDFILSGVVFCQDCIADARGSGVTIIECETAKSGVTAAGFYR